MDDASTARAVRKTVAILFADVVGWTQMCARLGDEPAKALVDSLFEELWVVVEANQGTVVKRIGDELMCVFDTAEAAARTACAMQRHTAERARGAAQPLGLRMGFHVGPAVMEKGDFFGDTANVAARVAGSGSRERVLATRAAAQHLPEDLARIVYPWRSEDLKGKNEPIEIVELSWREDGIAGTRIPAIKETGEPSFQRVTVNCQGMRYVLGSRPLRFGRSEGNNMRIDDPTCYGSGNHGQIELRGGKVELVDTSRNGIYVAFSDEKFFVMSKRLVLRDSGRMTLGRPPSDPAAIGAEFQLD